MGEMVYPDKIFGGSDRTPIQQMAHDCWVDGYQCAIDGMRDWADQFGTEQTKGAVMLAASMLEMAKP